MAPSPTVRSGAAALFLLAYTCSGLAGLVYEVTWTRLLTLHLGHTTAAASTVVGAFLLGLAAGAALMGPRARHLSPDAALRRYAWLEIAVGVAAVVMPAVLGAATPLLQRAYADGQGGLLFPLTRVGVAAALVCVPALALGATFPLAVRWFASASPVHTRMSGVLYAANTAGAAAGALLAGFVLIPAFGVWRTTLVAVGAGAASAGLALTAARIARRAGVQTVATPETARAGRRRTAAPGVPPMPVARFWLAAGVLALSGFAALLHELAWTRVLALERTVGEGATRVLPW